MVHKELILEPTQQNIGFGFKQVFLYCYNICLTSLSRLQGEFANKVFSQLYQFSQLILWLFKFSSFHLFHVGKEIPMYQKQICSLSILYRMDRFISYRNVGGGEGNKKRLYKRSEFCAYQTVKKYNVYEMYLDFQRWPFSPCNCMKIN